MSARYEEVIAINRRAYDGAVEERVGKDIPPWKHDQQAAFLELLVAEGKHSLLEVGAGTGRHGRFFADAGLDVVCTDLSPAMVEECRRIGLEAHERDFVHLDLGRRFDAVFAMNCMLHVPPGDLPAVLRSVHGAMQPGGLFFMGQYGGMPRDGQLDDDTYEPKRYFAGVPDEDLLRLVEAEFELVSFDTVDVGFDDGAHFQSAVLRR